MDYVSKCKYDKIDHPNALTEASTALQVKRATMNLKMFNIMTITCGEVLEMDVTCPLDKDEEFLRFWNTHRFRDICDLVVITVDEFQDLFGCNILRPIYQRLQCLDHWINSRDFTAASLCKHFCCLDAVTFDDHRLTKWR